MNRESEVTPVATHQEDTNSVKARVRNMFQSQKQALAGGLIAHGPKCEDPGSCKKNPCKVFEPDKIISSEVVEIPVHRRTHVSMGNYANSDLGAALRKRSNSSKDGDSRD